jgi:hypothetical protein
MLGFSVDRIRLETVGNFGDPITSESAQLRMPLGIIEGEVFIWVGGWWDVRLNYTLSHHIKNRHAGSLPFACTDGSSIN